MLLLLNAHFNTIGWTTGRAGRKKLRLRDMTDRAWFSRFFTTSGQEMEQVYSFNPGAHTGLIKV